MKRRDFIAMLGFVAGSSVASAWSANEPPLIGVLVGTSEVSAAADIEAFITGMRDLGYVEGSGFRMAYRYADGHYDRMSGLAKELMALKPDLVLAGGGSPAALAVKAISTSIPIVSPLLASEIALGLAASDARPGGNVTGISAVLVTLDAKVLEVAHDMLPDVRKFGLLVNSARAGSQQQLAPIEEGAGKLGIAVDMVDVRSPDELTAAFGQLVADQCGAVVVTNDGMFFSERQQLAALAEAKRLPDIYPYREHVEAGGLLSYGVDLRENFRRAAYYVDRIWKGTPPADLPIEFPTKLEMLVNLKRAKALGLAVPPSILMRADEVIE